MSFMNKFKNQFDALNIGERMQQYQNGQGTQAPPNAYGYASAPPASNPYGYSQSGDHAGPYGQAVPYEHQGGAQYSNSPHPPQYGYQQPAYAQQYYPSPGYGSPSPPANGTPMPMAAQQPLPSGHASPPPAMALATTTGSHAMTGYVATSAPRWLPFWSEQSRQWLFAETTGRVETIAPMDLPPMPAYPGSTTMRGDMSSPPVQMRPGMPTGEKKSSSHTIMAAAGGFVAGGVATALVYQAVDARKKKKLGAMTSKDFEDFAAYPGLKQDLECNICDQTICGPYAHCPKCDGGDYDICRDCLAQGQVCEGEGKHRMVKVYPKYWCNACNVQIEGTFYHCAICDDGDWDICESCWANDVRCAEDAGEGHQWAELYIPVRNGGGHAGSSSDSD